MVTQEFVSSWWRQTVWFVCFDWGWVDSRRQIQIAATSSRLFLRCRYFLVWLFNASKKTAIHIHNITVQWPHVWVLKKLGVRVLPYIWIVSIYLQLKLSYKLQCLKKSLFVVEVVWRKCVIVAQSKSKHWRCSDSQSLWSFTAVVTLLFSKVQKWFCGGRYNKCWE